jgi:predicted transcriptional regulator of viral defense system
LITETSRQHDILVYIKRLGSVFTTHDLKSVSGKSASTVAHSLRRLAKKDLLTKIYRGVWAESGTRTISPFEIIPFLFPRQRVYVSFISALHLHGIVEQIPQAITLASTAHTSMLRTKAGVFSVHQLSPALFNGFDWYKGEGHFLIAEPEKALIDSLYLSSRKKKQFRFFPELEFPSGFSFKRAEQWAKRIPEKKIRQYVTEKLQSLKER